MTLPSPRPASQLLAYLEHPDPEALAELLVAFANSDGGTIVIGLGEDGRPAGSVYADEIEGVLRAAERACRPPVQTGWEQLESHAGSAFAIKVARSPDLHSLADGRVLVRVGTENRPLGGEEIRQLAATKSAGDFESEAAPGARRDDLDEAMIAEYLAKRQARGPRSLVPSETTGPSGEHSRRPIDRPADEVLTEIGALTHDGRPTITGILLFGKSPQTYAPQAGLVFVKFVGNEPRGESGLAGYGRRDEIHGPLARVIEGSWQIIFEEMAVGAVVKGLEREEITEYPMFAVRECLVNAVCHRDYRLKGRRIEVRMFGNRMEVISPGGLPGFMTVDNLVEEHFSRNPRLVAGLFQWGYIEELGLGIDRMIEEMVQAGHPPPEFKATPYSFTVTLFNSRDRKAAPKWEKSMNERQARALTYIREHGSITNSDYRRLCPDVGPETLRLDLVDLVDRGVLLRIGAKKGTYYILK